MSLQDKKKFVTHEMRAARNAIQKVLERKSPIFSADVLHWLYVDVLLNNFEFDDVMHYAQGSKDTIEVCARRRFNKEIEDA